MELKPFPRKRGGILSLKCVSTQEEIESAPTKIIVVVVVGGVLDDVVR